MDLIIILISLVIFGFILFFIAKREDKINFLHEFVITRTFVLNKKKLEIVYNYNNECIKNKTSDKMIDYKLIPLIDYYDKLPPHMKMFFMKKPWLLETHFTKEEIKLLTEPESLTPNDFILELKKLLAIK